MSNNWTDRFVGDRMSVDQEFNQRVDQSEFSSQEWGMIMTAVELEIENPDDPETAQLVADTDKIPQVMPALDDVRDQMGGMGGAPSGGSSGGSGGDGIVGSIKNLLVGSGGGGGDEREQAAAELAQEYAEQFQERLESQGKWTRACNAAAESQN
ncbi:hypothetical protein SAMN06269185_0984 [Natronoarchaeum philippinense]|uniref:Uncharacterized protein n=1 Tax=Natronoarchaeum philippinense TaxID=558529 RepID=A0A285NAI2_NATPI|nr:DUF5799 family protein [Natronoarchaeum philippinense]SNZ05927.1 hypothetical protein SAMN06269185_0984 [Natronoarchaeum philippinense]